MCSWPPCWLPWYYNIINNTICYITALHIYMHISPCLYALWQDCSFPTSSHRHHHIFNRSKLCVEVGMWRGPIWYSETMENTEIFRCLNNKRQKISKNVKLYILATETWVMWKQEMFCKCSFVSVQRIVFESPIFPLGCMMTNFVCKIVMNGSGETLGPGGASATCAASRGGEDTSV